MRGAGASSGRPLAEAYFGHFCTTIHLEFLQELTAVRARFERGGALLSKQGWALTGLRATEVKPARAPRGKPRAGAPAARAQGARVTFTTNARRVHAVVEYTGKRSCLPWCPLVPAAPGPSGGAGRRLAVGGVACYEPKPCDNQCEVQVAIDRHRRRMHRAQVIVNSVRVTTRSMASTV